MNILKKTRSPFRLIALMAILFSILFVTFFPGIEESRSEFRIRQAYNAVCRLAKSETALVERKAGNTEDQNDALFRRAPMEFPQPLVSIKMTSTLTWLIHQVKHCFRPSNAN